MCVTSMLLVDWVNFLSECLIIHKPVVTVVVHKPTDTVNISFRPKTTLDRLNIRQFILDFYQMDMHFEEVPQ